MLVGSVVWCWRLWWLVLVLAVSGSVCHCTNGNTGSGDHIGAMATMLVRGHANGCSNGKEEL